MGWPTLIYFHKFCSSASVDVRKNEFCDIMAVRTELILISSVRCLRLELRSELNKFNETASSIK